jgi:hypothetical protein
MFVMVSVTVVMRGSSNNQEDGGTTSECECIQIASNTLEGANQNNWLKIKGRERFKKKKKKEG